MVKVAGAARLHTECCTIAAAECCGADYGLTREATCYYGETAALPMRWMAPGEPLPTAHCCLPTAAYPLLVVSGRGDRPQAMV